MFLYTQTKSTVSQVHVWDLTSHDHHFNTVTPKDWNELPGWRVGLPNLLQLCRSLSTQSSSVFH